MSSTAGSEVKEIWLYMWASGGLDHFDHKPTADEHHHADEFKLFVLNASTGVVVEREDLQSALVGYETFIAALREMDGADNEFVLEYVAKLERMQGLLTQDGLNSGDG